MRAARRPRSPCSRSTGDRAGDRGLRRARLRQGARAGRGPDRPAPGHAGRSGRFDARHHQGDLAAPVPVVGYVLGRRTHATPALTSSMRATWRDGARHQSGCGDAGPDRRWRLSAEAQPEPPATRARRRSGRGQAAAADRGWRTRSSTTRSRTSAASPSCAAAMPNGRSAPCAKLPASRRRRRSSDLIAGDLDELLQKLDGRQIAIDGGAHSGDQ